LPPARAANASAYSEEGQYRCSYRTDKGTLNPLSDDENSSALIWNDPCPIQVASHSDRSDKL